MFFDINIYEHWIDNPGNEAGGIKDIHLFADPNDYRDSYAYSLFIELVIKMILEYHISYFKINGEFPDGWWYDR